MHFALNCLIRLVIAASCSTLGWLFFHLPTVAMFSMGQAIFFVSFAAKQPDWRSLLGEPYLVRASAKISEQEKKLQCGGGKSRTTCTPVLNENNRKAIEIEFCLRRVDSRVVKLEEEMWRRTLLVGVASLLAVLYARLQGSGAVSVSTVQILELVTPLTLFFLTIGLAYAEISTQRNINLSAAGL
jgi:hypothetical protein